MIFRLMAAASVLAIAACGDTTGSTVTSTSVGGASASANANLTKAQIATCWTQAGLKGDIYKFLTPAEVQGISKVDGASKDQIATFKSCIAG